MGIFDSIKKIITGAQPGPPASAPLAKEPSPSFYIDSIELDRAEKDRFFRGNAYSPLDDRAGFTGLSYYPINPAYRFTLALNAAAAPERLTIRTNTGEERPFLRLGTVEFDVDGTTVELAIYRGEEHNDLFVPFKDATSGSETYGAGRYLEPEELSTGEIVLDFNLAYNPFCAYSTHYSCPLPPFENHLTNVAIRAGEKNYQP